MTRYEFALLGIDAVSDFSVKTPITLEILKIVSSRVLLNDRNDYLLLPIETEEVGPYELPLPRQLSGLDTYVPVYLNVPHLRRLVTQVTVS
jgi:myosin-5